MKLQNILSATFLAATTYAAEEEPVDPSPSPDPTPAGALWTAKWDASDLQPYQQKCLNRNTYTANIYKLSELYPDLKDFAPDLKIFYNKQLYAGSWDGVDHHGTKRELMRMPLSALPYKVREWLKKNVAQKHYAVQDDNVFFAPGALYPILPLWVEEPEQAECDDVFDDLEAYSNEVGDAKVVGKVTHSYEGEREVRFTVEALLLKAKGRAPTRKEGESDEL
ncbi:hypothetical protein ACEQ8H_002770 [Pleosporales sp. CAS-2024a]